ncbi:MAG: amidohydrolase [Aurantibacter sp.]
MSQELKIALVQTSLVWEDPEQNRSNFSKIISGISSKVDLIVLPEMFTTGFTMNPENLDDTGGQDTIAWMKEMAKTKNAAIAGSTPYLEDNNYTNRLHFVLADGKTYQYDKRHTFTLAGEDKVYQSGSKRLIIDYRGFRICPMICYDLRFPVWARYDGDYDILLFVANWPEPRITAWDGLLRARAIENMAYCTGVNRIGEDANNLKYPGHSAIYDPLGNQIVYSEKEEVLYASLNKQHLAKTRENLGFLEDRDSFNLLS